MTTLTDVHLPTGQTDEQGAVCHTRQAVAEIGTAVKADVEEMRYIAEDFVVEHPLRVVGLAVGVGFLLGVIWSR